MPDKMNTALIYHAKYLNHDTGAGHPESRQRLEVMMKAIKESGLLGQDEAIRLLEPSMDNSEKAILRVHPRSHIDFVKKISASGSYADPDTPASLGTYEAALLAVGGILLAGEEVVGGKARNAYAMVRPPGHHANATSARGFCFFNNIAVLAEQLHSEKKYDRILILDCDCHHGNGTQDIFYDKQYVLYISFHQDGRTLYPGTGFQDEVGEKEGEGYTVNVPLPPLTGHESYLKAVNEIAVPIAREYKPQIVLVSNGFDAHHLDPISSLQLTATTYREIMRVAMDLADELCAGRLVVTLEGGYSLEALPGCILSVLSQLTGIKMEVNDPQPNPDERVKGYVERLLKEVKRIQSSYWDL
ncbi:MAG: histone deacetylase [Promethearchaeati archaeon SRVP18_Atabeyarchaeia-1]